MTDKEPRVKVKVGMATKGIVYFDESGGPYPGWYCKSKDKEGKTVTQRLWTEGADDEEGARKEAATRLDCLPEQVVVKGK